MYKPYGIWTQYHFPPHLSTLFRGGGGYLQILNLSPIMFFLQEKTLWKELESSVLYTEDRNFNILLSVVFSSVTILTIYIVVGYWA
jgi:hypothetical protein